MADPFNLGQVPSNILKPRLTQFFGLERIEDLRPWERPKTPLPIDEEIQNLINQIDNRVARIRLQFDQTRALKVLSFIDLDAFEESPKPRCPFFTARYYLLRAAITADLSLKDAGQAVTKIDAMRGGGAALLDQCEKFERHLFSDDFCKPYNADLRMFDENSHLIRKAAWDEQFETIVALLPQMETALKTWLELASHERTRLVEPLKLREFWRECFVEGMGYCWKLLTDADPARQGPFHDFVLAAHRSVKDDAPMDRSIRNVLQKVAGRPVEDRWDREFFRHEDDEHGLPPFVFFENGKQIIWRGPAAWAPPPDLEDADEYDDTRDE